jgi:hypothetical protein
MHGDEHMSKSTFQAQCSDMPITLIDWFELESVAETRCS